MGNLKFDFDISQTNTILKNLTRAEKQQVNYGWLTKNLHDVHGWTKKVPTAQIVFWNEFGTRNIPQRPYLTITSIIAQVTVIPSIVKYFSDNIYGQTFDNSALFAMEDVIRKDFKSVLGSGKPLSKNTISKKGFDSHWVETGALLDDFEVVTNNRKLN